MAPTCSQLPTVAPNLLPSYPIQLYLPSSSAPAIPQSTAPHRLQKRGRQRREAMRHLRRYLAGEWPVRGCCLRERAAKQAPEKLHRGSYQESEWKRRGSLLVAKRCVVKLNHYIWFICHALHTQMRYRLYPKNTLLLKCRNPRLLLNQV